MNDRSLLLILSGVLLLLTLLSLGVGTQPLDWQSLLSTTPTPHQRVTRLILTEIRLPRTLLALLTGAALGLAGAVMQGWLRNPLASPDLLGSASGAALGAVVALYWGWVELTPFAQPLGGIAGALLMTLLVSLFAGKSHAILPVILAGLALSSLALALIALLLNLAPSPYAVQEIVLWMMGSLANHSMMEFGIALPGVVLGSLLLLGSGRALDALSLGEESAATLGFDLLRLRWRLLLAVALTVGSVVSISGTIGFIGLMVPHLLRPLVGYQPSRLLAVSALGGAALLLAADITTRLIPSSSELKVGILTALLGAPFFLGLILRSRHGGRL